MFTAPDKRDFLEDRRLYDIASDTLTFGAYDAKQNRFIGVNRRWKMAILGVAQPIPKHTPRHKKREYAFGWKPLDKKLPIKYRMSTYDLDGLLEYFKYEEHLYRLSTTDFQIVCGNKPPIKEGDICWFVYYNDSFETLALSCDGPTIYTQDKEEFDRLASLNKDNQLLGIRKRFGPITLNSEIPKDDLITSEPIEVAWKVTMEDDFKD